MKTHSFAHIERPEGANGGPEIIGRFRHYHQFFALHLGGKALGHRDRSQARKPRVSVTAVMKTGVLFLC